MEINAEEYLAQLLRNADELPRGPRQTHLLEQAIRLADSLEALEPAFAARLKLVEAEVFLGRADKALPQFLWCLTRANEHPEKLDLSRALWAYKWYANDLIRYPEISQRQIDALLDDIAARFKRFGWSARGPLQARLTNALRAGRREDAARCFALWQEAQRDAGADCEACERDRVVEHRMFMGDEAAALEAAAPILAGELTCERVPQDTIPRVLLPLLRAGRTAEACRLHRQSSPLLDGKVGVLESAAGHLLFCAVCGLIGGGSVVVSSHLGETVHNPDAWSTMLFLRAGFVFLRSLARRGEQLGRDLPSFVPCRRDTAAFQAQWFRQEAHSRAEALDRRNGNTFYREELQGIEKLLEERAWPAYEEDE